MTPPPTKSTTREQNAFSVLMSSSVKSNSSVLSSYQTNNAKKRKWKSGIRGKAIRSSSSSSSTSTFTQFVSCPAGCGTRLLCKEVDTHLDTTCSVLLQNTSKASCNRNDDGSSLVVMEAKSSIIVDDTKPLSTVTTNASTTNKIASMRSGNNATCSTANAPVSCSNGPGESTQQPAQGTKPNGNVNDAAFNEHITPFLVKITQDDEGEKDEEVEYQSSMRITEKPNSKTISEAMVLCNSRSTPNSPGTFSKPNFVPPQPQLPPLPPPPSQSPADNSDKCSKHHHPNHQHHHKQLYRSATSSSNDSSTSGSCLTSSTTNAFIEMMKKRNRNGGVFGDSKKSKNKSKNEQDSSSIQSNNNKHRLHLNLDGSVSLYLDSSIAIENCYWSTVVKVKTGNDYCGDGGGEVESHRISKVCTAQLTSVFEPANIPQPQPKRGHVSTVDLTVSSSIPSYRKDVPVAAQDIDSTYTPTKAYNIRTASTVPIGTATTPRLVKKHSRLSVPVLKSILQKAIRRRRPLPAVRVGMELIDKSLGELLRRLPIIIIEDSTLHPQMDCIIWMMVAHSKGYAIPPCLIQLLLQIIYEVASCQWHDDNTDVLSLLPTHTTKPDNIKNKIVNELVPGSSIDDNNHIIPSTELFTFDIGKTTFDKFISYCAKKSSCKNKSGSQNNGDVLTAAVADKEDCWIYSLFLRSEYGGMRCDVQMLRLHAAVWCNRFHQEQSFSCQAMPTDVTTPDCSQRLCFPSKPHDVKSVAGISYTVTPSASTTTATASTGNKTATCTTLLRWNEVPYKIHANGKKDGMERVTSILQCGGLEKLTLGDTTLDGIDFHCSPIIGHLLSDPDSCKRCLERLGSQQLQQQQPPSDKLRTESSDSFELYSKVNGPESSSINQDVNRDATRLEAFVRRMMWTCCSSINYRLPLVTVGTKVLDQRQEQPQYTTNQNPTRTSSTAMKSHADNERMIWTELFATKAKNFQTKYIQARLAL